MYKDNKNIGNYGETIATNYLSKNNYKILCRNFSVLRGEIDIISKSNGILIFTEVKTRYSKKFGLPFESISKSKVMRIKKAALFFMYKHNLSNINVRFDIIEIYLNYYDNTYKVNHIKNAFN